MFMGVYERALKYMVVGGYERALGPEKCEKYFLSFPQKIYTN